MFSKNAEDNKTLRRYRDRNKFRDDILPRTSGQEFVYETKNDRSEFLSTSSESGKYPSRSQLQSSKTSKPLPFLEDANSKIHDHVAYFLYQALRRNARFENLPESTFKNFARRIRASDPSGTELIDAQKFKRLANFLHIGLTDKLLETVLDLLSDGEGNIFYKLFLHCLETMHKDRWRIERESSAQNRDEALMQNKTISGLESRIKLRNDEQFPRKRKRSGRVITSEENRSVDAVDILKSKNGAGPGKWHARGKLHGNDRLRAGTQIRAKYQNGQFRGNGTVIRTHSDRSCDILYANGDFEYNVSPDQLELNIESIVETQTSPWHGKRSNYHQKVLRQQQGKPSKLHDQKKPWKTKFQPSAEGHAKFIGKQQTSSNKYDNLTPVAPWSAKNTEISRSQPSTVNLDQHQMQLMENKLYQKTSTPLNYFPRKGDSIEAKYRGRSRSWYPGIVTSVRTDGSCDIQFDDGDKDFALSPRFIRKPASHFLNVQKEMLSSPVLNKHDSVLGRYHGGDRYYKGKISGIRTRGYDIHYDDDDREVNVPRSRIILLTSYSGNRPSYRPRARREYFSRDKLLKMGAGVYAQYRKSKAYFPGIITSTNPDGTYAILFDDGDFDPNVQASSIQLAVFNRASEFINQTRASHKSDMASNGYMKGDKVRVDIETSPEYLIGTITGVHADNTFDIDYGDNLREKKVCATRVHCLNHKSSSGGRIDKKEYLQDYSPVARAQYQFSRPVIPDVNESGTYEVRHDGNKTYKTDALTTMRSEKQIDRSNRLDEHHAANSTQNAIMKGDEVFAKGTPFDKHRKGTIVREYHDGTCDVAFQNGAYCRHVPVIDVSATPFQQKADKIYSPLNASLSKISPQSLRSSSSRKSFRQARLSKYRNASIRSQFMDSAASMDSNSGRNLLFPDSTSAFEKGDHIFARRLNDLEYYAGTIVQVNSSRTYDIRFDDGDFQKNIPEANLVIDCKRSHNVKRRLFVEKDHDKNRQTSQAEVSQYNLQRHFQSSSTVDSSTQDESRVSRKRHLSSPATGNDSDKFTRADSSDSFSLDSGKELQKIHSILEAKKFSVGDKVAAARPELINYVDGEIIRINADGTYMVLFDDGHCSHRLHACDIFPQQFRQSKVTSNTAASKNRQTKFNEGDSVTVQYSSSGPRLTGQISMENEDGTFNIVYDDNSVDLNVSEANILLSDSAAKNNSEDISSAINFSSSSNAKKLVPASSTNRKLSDENRDMKEGFQAAFEKGSSDKEGFASGVKKISDSSSIGQNGSEGVFEKIAHSVDKMPAASPSSEKISSPSSLLEAESKDEINITVKDEKPNPIEVLHEKNQKEVVIRMFRDSAVCHAPAPAQIVVKGVDGSVIQVDNAGDVSSFQVHQSSKILSGNAINSEEVEPNLKPSDKKPALDSSQTNEFESYIGEMLLDNCKREIIQSSFQRLDDLDNGTISLLNLSLALRNIGIDEISTALKDSIIAKYQSTITSERFNYEKFLKVCSSHEVNKNQLAGHDEEELIKKELRRLTFLRDPVLELHSVLHHETDSVTIDDLKSYFIRLGFDQEKELQLERLLQKLADGKESISFEKALGLFSKPIPEPDFIQTSLAAQGDNSEALGILTCQVLVRMRDFVNKMIKSAVVKNVKEAFEMFDTDHDEQIGRHDMFIGLKAMGLDVDLKLVEAVIRRLDPNENAEAVGFDSFRKFFTNHASAMPRPSLPSSNDDDDKSIAAIIAHKLRTWSLLGQIGHNSMLRIFHAHDPECKGEIPRETFQNLASSLLWQLNDSEMQVLADKFTIEKERFMYKEFVNWLKLEDDAIYCLEKEIRKFIEKQIIAGKTIVEVFKIFDSHDCGYISSSDVRTVMMKVGYLATEDEAEEFIRRVVEKPNDRMGFDSFTNFVLSKSDLSSGALDNAAKVVHDTQRMSIKRPLKLIGNLHHSQKGSLGEWLEKNGSEIEQRNLLSLVQLLSDFENSLGLQQQKREESAAAASEEEIDLQLGTKLKACVRFQV